MRLHKLHNLFLVFFLFLGLGCSFAQSRKSANPSREQLFKETCRLLDVLEDKYPQSQVEFVRLRERILKLYQTPKIISADKEQAIAGSINGISVDWQNFYDSVRKAKNEELKHKLQNRLKHQKALEYKYARRYIFLKVDNYDNKVEGVYTGRVIEAKHMPKATNMNIEHSWPQSLGAKGIAKSDLHHLFPCDSKANSERGSLLYNYVDDPTWEKGGSKCNGRNFECRKKTRGNIARAQFYFSVRYNKKISPSVEKVLREWNKQDPVDKRERERNNRIEKIQTNRNPFIDHPEFIDQIDDF